MAFTSASVSHTFTNADGTACSGNVEATLTELITNGSTSVAPNNIVATLTSAGVWNQTLVSNLDTATVPQDSQWRIDIRIQGVTPVTYYIVVPSGGGTYDLGALLPGAQQVA